MRIKKTDNYIAQEKVWIVSLMFFRFHSEIEHQLYVKIPFFAVHNELKCQKNPFCQDTVPKGFLNTSLSGGTRAKVKKC